jgi:hypothetical protein
MDALRVERAQLFVNELGKLRRQRRLLDVVFSLEQVDGIRPARGDLLADGARRR